MGKKIQTNEAVVSEYLKLGMKQKDIAARLGVSRSWVALFARLNGLSRPKAGRPSRYDFNKIEELLGQGKTYVNIVEELRYPSVSALRAAIGYRKRKSN